jgi:hypothetical protein
LLKKPPRPDFSPEGPTKPSVSSPLGHVTGTVPKSRRDPAELVSVRETERARSSQYVQRPALRMHGAIPREAREDREPRDEAASTPRPVNGGIALEAVPRLVAPPHKLTGLPIDHQAGFVLANIDGESTVQTLIDVSGLPPHDVVKTLERLLALGVLVVR